ncbi:MAG: ABC transporter permease [Acholeplasmataceae bacterium]|nr:ABC transporter permease [Acholeplasmataceae bacterium]
MNIIKRELKANLKSFLIWLIPLSLIMYIVTWEFQSFAGNSEIIDAMESFEFLFQALGASITDITTPEGYISLVSLYIFLPLTIYSGLLGSNIISKEEKDKTAEYLFTLPVKRTQVIKSKLIVSVIYSLLINVLLLTVICLSYLRFDRSDQYFNFIINLSIGAFLTQIIFLGLGMILSAMLKQYKKSGSLTIAALMGTYLISVLITMVDGKLDFIKFLIPFQYFPANAMLLGEFNIFYIILSIAIFATTSTFTFIFYKKRDLYL